MAYCSIAGQIFAIMGRALANGKPAPLTVLVLAMRRLSKVTEV
jgi:hypothetical protein